MNISIKFIGGAKEVTGSAYLVSIDDYNFLVDAGMKQGKIEDISHLDAIDLKSVQAILITHGHIDHTGGLPYLVKKGFAGAVHCTTATANVMMLLIRDSAKIMKNKVYDEKDITALNKLLNIHDFDVPFTLGPAKITFRYAAHILGAASIEIEAGNKKIGFSGDIGSYSSVIHDEVVVPKVDILVMESTYGDRTHSAPADRDNLLLNHIKSVVSSGGNILIPVFAIGRAQEILATIKKFKGSGLLENNIKVFFDTPMGKEATKLYIENKSYLKSKINNTADLNSDLFNFPGLEFVGTPLDLNTLKSSIILSASGMLTGGRIIKYAKKILPDSSSKLIFVGYQGSETPGRQLLSHVKTIMLDDDSISVNAEIVSIDGFSAHADQPSLINYAKESAAKNIILVHGEESAQTALAQKLNEQSINTQIAEPGEIIEIQAEKIKTDYELPQNLTFFDFLEGKKCAFFTGAIIKEGIKIKLVTYEEFIEQYEKTQNEKIQNMENIVKQIKQRGDIPIIQTSIEDFEVAWNKIEKSLENISKKKKKDLADKLSDSNIRGFIDHIDIWINKNRYQNEEEKESLLKLKELAINFQDKAHNIEKKLKDILDH